MLQTTGEIVGRTTLGAVQELRVRAPELASELKPGQPVLVRSEWGADPHLRRAFYPIEIEQACWVMRLLPSADRAHAWMRVAPLGTQLDCLGPVGNGFRRPTSRRRVLCLGGGVDSWTLLPAAVSCASEGAQVTLTMSGASRRDLVPPSRVPPSVEMHLFAADTGAALKLERSLPDMLLWADLVMACGEMAFYAELARAIRAVRFDLRRDFAQVLIAAPMLCGSGACQACAVDLVRGRRRACTHGPVFDLSDVAP